MSSSQLLKSIKFFALPPKSHPSPLESKPISFLPSRIHLRIPPIRKPSALSFSLMPLSAITPPCLSEEPTVNPILEFLCSLRKPAIAAVLLAFLLAARPLASFAASGGRMGGSSFSSFSSSSSSLDSYSSSSFIGSEFPSEGLPCSSWRYSSSWSGDSSYPSNTKLKLLVMLPLIIVAVLPTVSIMNETRNGMIHVLKLQVGFLGTAQSLQNNLNLIAETADTSNQKGLNYILTESSLALLQLSDYCISAHSSVSAKLTMEDAEKCFNQHSFEERGKLDEETLVNFNNLKRRKLLSKKPNGLSNEYIVVTVLVVVAGFYKLPVISNIMDLKDTLNKLCSIPISQTLAVEVLWTPQSEHDTLSEIELLQDYPLLMPLQEEIYAADAR
ncbi:hypothetical protein J5N97_010541 [Dioscorea zingiberensis]|uniref:Uncharacterized protein n=1 Tax=Dioscorea zingiberensis TaxID=325984 RepID=A0A9D5CZB0_9LILI|nr:hypothetical protein J5N97_010541 [Dioscorea zingiberensis]